MSCPARTGEEEGACDCARGAGSGGLATKGRQASSFSAMTTALEMKMETKTKTTDVPTTRTVETLKNLDDVASVSSGGNGESVPGGRTRPSRGGATVHAFPVHAADLNGGGASHCVPARPCWRRKRGRRFRAVVS